MNINTTIIINIDIINIISIADALTTASYLVGRKTQALNSNTEC